MFEGTFGDVALTAAGGLRQLSGLSEEYESPSLVCNSHSLICFLLVVYGKIIELSGNCYLFLFIEGKLNWSLCRLVSIMPAGSMNLYLGPVQLPGILRLGVAGR